MLRVTQLRRQSQESTPYSNPSSTPAEALKSDGQGFDSWLCLLSWVTLSMRS